MRVRRGQTWTCDEARADPEDVPGPHDTVALWPDYPRFSAVVDDVLDDVAQLTVATSNSHPRAPDHGAIVDVHVDTLVEGARWECKSEGASTRAADAPVAADGAGGGYPSRRVDEILDASEERYIDKINEYGVGRNWLDDDAEYHLWRAIYNIANSNGAEDLGELGDAVNHLAMARDIAVDERMQPDGGAVRRQAQGSAAQLAGVGDQDTECEQGVEGCPGPAGDFDAMCFGCLFNGGDQP